MPTNVRRMSVALLVLVLIHLGVINVNAQMGTSNLSNTVPALIKMNAYLGIINVRVRFHVSIFPDTMSVREV